MRSGVDWISKNCPLGKCLNGQPHSLWHPLSHFYLRELKPAVKDGFKLSPKEGNSTEKTISAGIVFKEGYA